jgi:AbrB family looped-hinge helix DNA binding protein
MAQAVVSTKFQIVIPKEIREQVHLKSGQVMQVLVKNGIITLVPDQPLSSLRGRFKGMRTDHVREKVDRL